MIVKADALFSFLTRCAKEELSPYSQVFFPLRPTTHPDTLVLSDNPDLGTLEIDSYRPVDPVKLLLYSVRERVYPEIRNVPERLIVGVKACDLRAVEVLDRAMINDDFTDPSYAAWRKATTLVSCDCTATAPTCHCTLVDGKPYAESGFDANLSRLGDEFLLTATTEKGKAFVQALQDFTSLAAATRESKIEVTKNREQMIQQVDRQNADLKRSRDYTAMRKVKEQPWEIESKECVGCGACTHICPTCYCLILNDESQGKRFVKVRSYDSCQWNGYARVAGGGTPRPKMTERFRNRYLCKFDYMPSNFDRLGCTGCGRCTDACPAKIDFRSAVQMILKAGTLEQTR
ncbi:4Fe-4S dicluster domain-containing protein [candidate division KSB1 bacterium]|nr:4Fe-4S dicluster domain-containing protein [candidate division KSB1 bacterium]